MPAPGKVREAPKLPAEAPLWLAVNLLFTRTAEEALFRGFVQGGLRRAWATGGFTSGRSASKRVCSSIGR